VIITGRNIVYWLGPFNFQVLNDTFNALFWPTSLCDILYWKITDLVFLSLELWKKISAPSNYIFFACQRFKKSSYDTLSNPFLLYLKKWKQNYNEVVNTKLKFFQSNEQEILSVNSASLRNEVKPETRLSGNSSCNNNNSNSNGNNNNRSLSPKSQQQICAESSMEIEDISDLSSFGSRYERCKTISYKITIYAVRLVRLLHKDKICVI